MAEGPLLVVDGDSFAHRAYHGVPKTVKRAGGKGGNAILGFTNTLIRLIEAEKPRAVFIGWDKLSEPNWRARELPGYQGGRIFDDSIVEQLDVLPELMSALGFGWGKGERLEADDYIASAATEEEKRGGTALVASGDRDTFQLASDHITILHPVKGGELARIGPHEVVERYGVLPEQVPDFIALRGDPSDKIPGAKGVGAITAAGLLLQHGTLEAILAAGKFANQADDLRLYGRIATMVRDVKLPPIPTRAPDWAGGAALLRKWELNGLADRLEKLAAA
ncbi:MAG TPA: 5'-3' exonuclease H3TH domain-containing protein [Devosia sp.]|nr:5'-3' exonuclease H3TH domain-containing protein [Devosia sp.]